jgi:RNA recognition motif-containing protein
MAQEASQVDEHAENPEAAEPPVAARISSRLCVKNLPPYVDELRLREHFAAKGEVTDAKIVRTR